LMRAKLEFRAS